MGGEGNNFRSGDGSSHRLAVGTDALIATLAARQQGRVTRKQLLAAGITPDAIDHRIRCRRLHREHDGVYAVGYRTHDLWGRFRSALLAVGDDGVVGHFAAAAGHVLGPEPVVIDIACPRKLRSRRGIRLHQRVLEPRDIVRVNGLPLTSPSQTLFDLSARFDLKRLLNATNEAFVQRIVTVGDLRESAVRNAGRPGSATFTRMLARVDPEGREVRSPLEIRLNAFLRHRGFPSWESNVTILVGGEKIKPDVLWRKQRVIIEADGRDPHNAPLTFDSDRRRDRRLRVEGWELVRVTSRHLDHDADELEVDLWAFLTR